MNLMQWIRLLQKLQLKITTPILYHDQVYPLTKNFALRPKGVPILLYHRIAPNTLHPFLSKVSGPISPYRICNIEPEIFAEQMKFLIEEGFQFKTLSELREGPAPSGQKWVAITFDDIFRDALTFLVPILQELRIKATLFFISGVISSSELLWQHRLYRELQGGDEEKFFNQVRAIVKRLSDTSNKDIYQEILSTMPTRERKNLFRELPALSDEKTLASELYFTKEELASLSKHPLIEIGSHSHQHYYMSHLSPAEYLKELSVSKNTLEEIIQKPVLSFSYPHNDYRQDDELWVKEVGYLTACTVDESRYQNFRNWRLHRINVRDTDDLPIIRRMVHTHWVRDRAIKSNHFFNQIS